MRVGLFIFTALCFLHTNVHPQAANSEPLYLQLDSLLLNNRIEEFYATLEKLVDIQKLDNEKIDFYQKVISKLNSLQNITPSKSITYLNTYLKLSAAFVEKNAGHQSKKAFESFLAFLSEKDTSNALIQITIAFCFKERFTKDKRNHLLNLYEKANLYLNKDDPDSALIMLRTYNDEINSVKSLSYIKDSLRIRSNLLRDKALRRIIEHKQMKNPIVSDKFQISYSFAINTSLPISDKYWPYVDRVGPKHILAKTGGLNSHFDQDHAITFCYFVFNNLSSGVEYNFGELRYSSPAIFPGFVSTDTYTARNRMLSLVFNHYFNNRVGFRQYMGMGFGYAEFDLKIDKSLTRRYDPQFYSNVFELDRDQTKHYTTLLSLRFGIDYVLDNPNLILGASLNYTYILEDIFYIDQNVFRLSLSMGYHF